MFEEYMELMKGFHLELKINRNKIKKEICQILVLVNSRF